MPLDTNDNMTDVRLAGPGASLKAKREAGGYSLADVSKDIRVTCTRLAALEADDYGRVGSDTFVIGYIRQYAKWLGMDAEELVASYKRAVGRESAGGTDYSSVQQTQPKATTGKKGLPLLWFVIGLLILWLVAAMFLNNGGGDPQERRQPNAQREEAPVVSGDEEPEQEIPSEPMNPVEELEPEPTYQSKGDVKTPSQPEVGTQEQVLEEAVPISSNTREPQPAARTQTEPESTAALDQLSMSFSGDCWVEVRNASGDLLFAQLQNAGDNLQLLGQAPFQVLLGDARAATVQVNGRQVDINPRPNRDTMRLRVGP
jgi:cytoskeleton protein RodZ